MMPVSMEWGNDERTVIIATVEWPWTWDELALSWNTGVEMMRSVPHDVHTIALAKTSRFPIGNILTNLTAITRNVPSNIGLAIMVTENRFQETINNIFFKLSPRLSQKGRVVHNLDEAFALIARETKNHDRVK